MVKISKSFADSMGYPGGGARVYWDDKVKGYGLRVSDQGKRVFIAMGRVNGKSIQFTIGPYSLLTEDQARKKAQSILQGMREGIDPREARKRAIEAEREAAVEAITMREVVDAYLRDRPLKTSSRDAIERHATTTFEAWLKKPLKDVTREMVTKRFNEIRTSGLRGDGPAPGQANQSMSVLRALFNYAIREYRKPDGALILADNPVDVLYKKWAPLKPRTSRVPDGKVGAVWSALRKWRGEAYNRDTMSSIDLVMMLMLTGLRIGECCSMTWEQVNMEEGWVHIPDPKNSNPVWLPLSTQAIELLTTRQRVPGNPHVFPSWGNAGHIKDPRDTMKRVSEVAGTKITPHDLRRTFVTLGVSACSIDLHKVELLTNHVPKGVTARHYLETTHLQYLRSETQRISDWIEERARIARAMATGENVIAIRA